MSTLDFATQASSPWNFHNPVQIRVGCGTRGDLPNCLSFATRLLVVCTKGGRQRLLSDRLLGQWAHSTHLIWMDEVTENPGLQELQSKVDHLKQSEPFHAIVGIGGGSALDTAKVLKVALSEACSDFTIETLLSMPEIPRTHNSCKLFLLPTTSGTGSEVTPFATVWNHQTKKKYSLAGTEMYPQIAVVDPELTYGLNAEYTITTGLDAVNQACESLWNRHANHITTCLATRSLQLSVPALLALSQDLENRTARANLSQASLLAGLAISQTRTALCHSISYPITAHFGIPHGLACAFTMPAVLEHCLRNDDGRLQNLGFYLLGKQSDKSDLLKLFRTLNNKLGVRQRVCARLEHLSHLLDLVPAMTTPGRADNCFVPANDNDLRAILSASWNDSKLQETP